VILRNLLLQKVFYILAGLCLLATGCNESPYMQGKRLYESHCQSCHMEDGQGLSRMIPSLATSSLLGKREFSCVIILGKKDTIQNQTSFLVQEMPAFQSLTTTELTNLVNYLHCILPSVLHVVDKSGQLHATQMEGELQRNHNSRNGRSGFFLPTKQG